MTRSDYRQRLPGKLYSQPHARQLGGLVQRIGDKSFRRRGFVHGQIVTQWADIVGTSLASVSTPERLRFPSGKKRGGTLMIRAESAAALELQHYLTVILDRVNVYFGYRAVEKISIRQGPVASLQPARRQTPRVRPLAPQQKKAVANAAKHIQNQQLKDALERLGVAVMQRQ
ncbi:MAG: DciA family protein [Pseudomonadota bacterium]